MIDERTRTALFIEIHRSVENAASSAVDFKSVDDMMYPPSSGGLLPEEREALVGIQLSPLAESGLKKIIAHACISPIFDFFALLDGVADPEAGYFDPWLGLTLAPKPEEDEPMLHDELYESYWSYKEHMDKADA